MNVTQSAKHLIPEYWNIKWVKTVGDLVFLGKVTVRQLVRYWRGEAESLAGQIKYTQELIDLLKGKTGKDFAKLAECYENPVFSQAQIGKRSDSWSGDFEPLDPASASRKSEATTFNVCGWCKFTGGGTCRYQYHITTSCNILTHAGLPDNDLEIPQKAIERYQSVEPLTRLGATDGEKEAAVQAIHRMEAAYPGLTLLVEKRPEWSTKTQRRFNTPCFLTNADMPQIEFMRGVLIAEKQKLIEKKKKVDSDIKLLLSLEKQAEEKPALPSARPYDWFNLNDQVVCFVGNWKDRIYQDVWATGKVINGYRHQDGCVSVNFDEKIHNGPYLEGHGGGYGMARPEVMLLWEYHYLRQHPDFAGLWILAADKHLQGFNPKEMLNALTLKALPATTK